MALFRRRGGFGREDRQPLLTLLLRADSFVIRLIFFIVAALIYYGVVRITHPSLSENTTDSVTVIKKNAPKK